MTEIQRTLVIIKPDAVQRGLVGKVVHRFERKGLKNNIYSLQTKL